MGEIFWVKIFRVKIFLGENFWGENFWGEIFFWLKTFGVTVGDGGGGGLSVYLCS